MSAIMTANQADNVALPRGDIALLLRGWRAKASPWGSKNAISWPRTLMFTSDAVEFVAA